MRQSILKRAYEGRLVSQSGKNLVEETIEKTEFGGMRIYEGR